VTRAATAKLRVYPALAGLGLIGALALGRPELAALAAPFAVLAGVGLALAQRPELRVLDPVLLAAVVALAVDAERGGDDHFPDARRPPLERAEQLRGAHGVDVEIAARVGVRADGRGQVEDRVDPHERARPGVRLGDVAEDHVDRLSRERAAGLGPADVQHPHANAPRRAVRR